MRQLLTKLYPTTDQLEAFCLDYFPRVSQEFGGAMNRTCKENILLKQVPVADLYDCLVDSGLIADAPPEEVPRCSPVDDVLDAMGELLRRAGYLGVSVFVLVNDSAVAQHLSGKVAARPLGSRYAPRAPRKAK